MEKAHRCCKQVSKDVTIHQLDASGYFECSLLHPADVCVCSLNVGVAKLPFHVQLETLLLCIFMLYERTQERREEGKKEEKSKSKQKTTFLHGLGPVRGPDVGGHGVGLRVSVRSGPANPGGTWTRGRPGGEGASNANRGDRHGQWHQDTSGRRRGREDQVRTLTCCASSTCTPF